LALFPEHENKIAAIRQLKNITNNFFIIYMVLNFTQIYAFLQLITN
jgi:hypothetical protein